MSAELTPPTIEISSDFDAEEQLPLKTGARSPRPYNHEGHTIQQYAEELHGKISAANGRLSPQRAAERFEDGGLRNQRSGQASVAASDSGTEADDERPNFLKALPAPHLRSRKGLKTGESNVDVLLTPSQLDDEGRRLSVDYFDRTSPATAVSKDEKKAEEDKLLKIRLAELARRTSEVGCMAFIICCVLCGQGVWQAAYQWRRELLSHVAIITTLVLVYPVKLSIVDSSSQARKIWQRFRVPASFDPATVLYPTLLPVLVSLSVLPADPATILPNIILGLSSLPQRLFPRSSRLGELNALHWLIAIVPLLASENTAWPSKQSPAVPYMLKSGQPNGLLPETLVCFYPLHHALLQPLQYLTTTSLLLSELHLLSAALINLLLLVQSPQAVILKACLWIGGTSLFLVCEPLLRWNVMLVRVPKWRFRRQQSWTGKPKSLTGAVLSLIGLHRRSIVSPKADAEDSDADEDEPTTSIKHSANGRDISRVSSLKILMHDRTPEPGPKSAIEPPPKMNGSSPELPVRSRPRSNTLPVFEPPAMSQLQSPKARKEHSSNVSWVLDLTPAQAQIRKWIYAASIYAIIIATILIPVRYYVLEKALHDQEPIGWALGYLFGEIDVVRSWVFSYGLEDWIAIPSEPATWQVDLKTTLPLNIPSLRHSFGAANTRLLLIAYWAPVLLTGLLVVFSLTAIAEVDTRRKVFHGVMVAMMLPSTFIDPCACALALTLILAIFLLLEVIRAGQVTPLGNAISRFVAPYVDGRDLRGPVVVSHLFLLTGCAVPLWFSLASIPRTGDSPWIGWELADEKREVAMLAGVVCVGMGDAAASLIGRRYGKHKWIWVGGKSIEGSAAFAVAVTVGLMVGKIWLVVGGWRDCSGDSMGTYLGKLGTYRCVLAWSVSLVKAFLCACGASFMEAVLTGANDNVVVPVALWLLVKGVRL